MTLKNPAGISSPACLHSSEPETEQILWLSRNEGMEKKIKQLKRVVWELL